MHDVHDNWISSVDEQLIIDNMKNERKIHTT